MYGNNDAEPQKESCIGMPKIGATMEVQQEGLQGRKSAEKKKWYDDGGTVEGLQGRRLKCREKSSMM